MKAFVIICLIVILFSILFPIFYTLRHQPGNRDAEKSPAGTDDADAKITVLSGTNVTEMTLRDYLTGVVAAEMPASFEYEALKAQAVAARTYTLYKIAVSPSSRHPGANVCTDSACCKAYISTEKMRENWGENFESNFEKIKGAVLDTDGQCLVYNGEPILAVFHSSSAGKTEDSGNVWVSQLPYLVSVESPETDESVPNFKSSVDISYEDFRQTILNSHPEAVFPEDRTQWISDIEKDGAGRVSFIKIGGITFTGTEIRSLFSLRSAAFEIELNDAVTITTTGYGHGVGMSQYGANIFAKEGKTYDEILKWYYTGAEIGNIGSFL